MDIDYEKLKKRLEEARLNKEGYKVGTASALGSAIGANSAADLYSYTADKGLNTGAKIQQHYDQLTQPYIQQTPSISQPRQQTTQPQTTQATPYASPYQTQVDDLLNQIMNAPKFSYDAMNDPLYQSYKQQYQQAGDRSFQDTIGDLSGLTGGRLNTWATSAAAQARQGWDDKLMQTVPELYNLAYGMYMQGVQDKYNQLGQLRELEGRDYSRYRDTVGDARYADELAYQRQRDDEALQRMLGLDEDARKQAAWQMGMGERQQDFAEQQAGLGQQMDILKLMEQLKQSDWQRGFSEQQYSDSRSDSDWQKGITERQLNFDEWLKKEGLASDAKNMELKERQQAFNEWLSREGINQDWTKIQEQARQFDVSLDYQKYIDAINLHEANYTPSAQEMANYNQILQGLLSNNDNPADALNYIKNIGEETYKGLIGENLYKKLLADIQSGFSSSGTEGTFKDYVKMIEDYYVGGDMKIYGEISAEKKHEIGLAIRQLEENGVDEAIINGLLSYFGFKIYNK